MTRTNIEQVSVRFPAELLKKVDALKDIDGVDRTTVINRAVKYWADINGKVLADNEYLKKIQILTDKIDSLEKEQLEMAATNNAAITEIREFRTLLMEQQKTINRLIEVIGLK